MVTPLLKLLKQDGYHVTYNTTEKGVGILKLNPNIDKFLFQKTNQVDPKDLDAFWNGLSERYDRFINLSESIEGTMLKIKGREDFEWSTQKRQSECSHVNYYDRTLEIGGYKDVKGMLPELHFSSLEENLARKYRAKYKDRFMILWSLSGSSFHKAYPYAESVAMNILNLYDDTMTVTIGDGVCELIEWQHPRAKCHSGKWPIRKSLIMAKYADLIIAPETGIANAAGCFDTPKIIMLSHSSKDNLTKYFKNCISLEADAPCHPCHKLHYSLDTCPIDEMIKSPVCMAWLEPEKLKEAIEHFYNIWKEKKYASHSLQRPVCV